MPPPPLPPLVQTLTDIVTDGVKFADDVAKKMAPVIAAGYAFSQVVGHLLAAQDDQGPPPTYDIGNPDPSSPTVPGQKQYDVKPYTPIATLFVDQVLGQPIPGTGFGIYVGPGLSDVAFAVASPAMSGNPTIVGGPGHLPLAGIGGSTATGAPIVDSYDEGVHMAMPMSHSTTGKHFIYTAGGTMSTPTDQSPAAFAQRCGDHPGVMQYYNWIPVEYPAETFPMGPGVRQGIEFLVQKISENPGTFALVGYSQGSVITCKVWRDEIMNPNGRLHDRLGDIFAHVNFGNPMRCPGIANGNGLAKIPLPEPLEGYVTGGIAGPDDLTPWQTPAWQIDFAHDGDVWTCCPVGADPWHDESPVGEAETSIYNIFMEKFFGQASITAEIGQLLINPIPNIIGIIEGLVNIIGFFGGNRVPHENYHMDDCLNAAQQFLIFRGKSVPT